MFAMFSGVHYVPQLKSLERVLIAVWGDLNIDCERTYSSAAKDGLKAHSLTKGSAASPPSLACIQCVIISQSCFYYSQLFSIVLEAKLTLGRDEILKLTQT